MTTACENRRKEDETVIIPASKLWYGDCLEEMKRIPDKTVNLIITDLPYGRTHNEWDKPLDLKALWVEYKRIITDNGVIALFADGMFMADLMLSNKKLWRYNLVWDKVLTSGFLNAKRMPLRRHEEICIFYKRTPVYNPQFTEGNPLHSKGRSYFTKKPTNRNYGEYVPRSDTRCGCTKKYPTSIVRFQKVHPSKVKHPTEKPVDCLRWLIRTYSNPNDIVLDSCMGSGSTGVAALTEGRNFIGIEKDWHTFQLADTEIRRTKKDLYQKATSDTVPNRNCLKCAYHNCEYEDMGYEDKWYHYCMRVMFNRFERYCQGESSGNLIDGFMGTDAVCPSFEAKEGADSE